MCIFVLLRVYLQGDVLRECQNVNSHVVLLDIAKCLSIRVAPVFIPTGNKNACFPTILPNVNLLDVVISAHPSCQRRPGYFFGFILPLLS